MSTHTQKGAVAAGHELTAKAARHAFEMGGNAVDAAIAAAWMACVAEPVLASPGGGGFAMAGGHGRKPQLCDFFAQTPRRANERADFHAIEANFGDATQTFHIGLGSVATPGFVPGLFALHAAHARLPMGDLIAPAAAIARTGHEVNAFQAFLARVISPILTNTEGTRAIFAPNGHLLKQGETLKNPALARFLELLAQGGLDSYANDIWPALLAGMDASGHLTQDDLEHYRVHWRTPLDIALPFGHAWLNPPPAASGVLIALARQALAEDAACPPCAWARALDAADRIRHDSGHDLDALMQELGLPQDAAPKAYRGTTHISTIDADGLACAMTISNGEGCGHVVPGFGFMLNNMLGETDVNPAGRSGWPKNVRLSSMMAPALARREDGALFVLGSGGSNRIRSVIFLMLARLFDEGADLEAAIEAPRLHVEHGHLDFEPGFAPQHLRAMEQAFPDHRAWRKPGLFFGGCHAAARLPDGSLVAHGDPRRAGAAQIAP